MRYLWQKQGKRRLLAQGVDPLDARKAAKQSAKAKAGGQTSFGEFARSYIELHEGGWKNPKHAAQWHSTILGPQGETDRPRPSKRIPMPDYCGKLRKMPISEVDTADILDVIRPYWNTKRETASRIRQRIEAILDAAAVDGVRPPGMNPARWKGHLALLLPNKGKSGGHFKAMPWLEVPAFLLSLSDRSGVAARALEFTILCAARSGEVRGALWAEIDLEAKVWTVPADRMKAGKEHRVPLSEMAVEAVEAMLPLRPRRENEIPRALVFPGLRRRPLSDMTLAAVLRLMEVEGAAVHGFRSSCRDWAADAPSAPFDVVEAALAHQIGNETTRAYLRADFFQKRRDLMNDWAIFLSKAKEPKGE